ncbi:hypothetical protein SDC9_158002 [bioreactor metagenome]|uniref:Uncharacterized protein n=1 Tax=bioreactor metagenome TaxID=1076179 RepID=A0A645F8K4_9ZZZZ
MEEQHHGGGLGVFTDRPCPGGRQRHQQVFVEEIAGEQVAERVEYHAPAGEQVDEGEHGEGRRFRNVVYGHDPPGGEQCGGNADHGGRNPSGFAAGRIAAGSVRQARVGFDPADQGGETLAGGFGGGGLFKFQHDASGGEIEPGFADAG